MGHEIIFNISCANGWAMKQIYPTKIQLYIYIYISIYNLYRVLLVLAIQSRELKIIFRTSSSSKFVNQNTLTHISQDGS